jgi:hypothetical protein
VLLSSSTGTRRPRSAIRSMGCLLVPPALRARLLIHLPL